MSGKASSAVEVYPMRWFRLYDELVDDPKVQELHPQVFRCYINILCLANRGKPRGRINPARLPFALRLTQDQVDKMLKIMLDAELLERDGDVLVPHGWDNRQFSSDNVTERTAKHRRNVSKNVLQNEPKNDEQNTPETETETDTETPPFFPPKGGGRHKWNSEWKMPREWAVWALKEGLNNIEVGREFDKFRDYWLGEGKPKADWFATWRTWIQNAKSFSRARTNGRAADLTYYSQPEPEPDEEARKEAEWNRVVAAYWRQMDKDVYPEQARRAMHGQFQAGLEWDGSKWVQTDTTLAVTPACVPVVTNAPT